MTPSFKTLARDVMSTQVITLSPGDTYRHAVELLTRHRLTGLPVVDQERRLVGFISEKDILSQCETYDTELPNFLDRPVEYRKAVKTVTENAAIDEVGAILAGKSFRHLPVLDESGKLSGIITRRDMIRILYLRIELGRVTE